MAKLKERTKVVVRKLPPGLNEQGFRAVVDKLIEGRYTWLAYCDGKVRQVHCWRVPDVVVA
jgi:hypothetical protein